MVEVMVGAVILALALVPVLDVMIMSFKEHTVTVDTMLAVNLAMCKLNEIQHMQWPEIAVLPSVIQYPDLPFEGTLTVRFHPDYPPRASDKKNGEIAEVEVEIQWEDQKSHRNRSISLNTLVTSKR